MQPPAMLISGKWIIPARYTVNNWKYAVEIRIFPISTFGSVFAVFGYYQYSHTLQNEDDGHFPYHHEHT